MTKFTNNSEWNSYQLYKPPLSRDIPEDLRITLLKNAPNPIGILRSKGISNEGGMTV
jgi:hypothetical protein